MGAFYEKVRRIFSSLLENWTAQFSRNRREKHNDPQN
jgi:hypothetical protein